MLFKTKLNPHPTRIPGERGSSFPAQPFKAAGTPHDQLTKKRTFASCSQSLYHYCQELNYSGATPDSFPALLRPTFPHYSSVHSRATPVHTPVLLQSTTGLDRTPLDLPFDRTRA